MLYNFITLIGGFMLLLILVVLAIFSSLQATSLSAQQIAISYASSGEIPCREPFKTVRVRPSDCLYGHEITPELQAFFRHLKQPCLTLDATDKLQETSLDEGCLAKKCLGGHAYLASEPGNTEKIDCPAPGRIVAFQIPPRRFAGDIKKELLVKSYAAIIKLAAETNSTAILAGDTADYGITVDDMAEIDETDETVHYKEAAFSRRNISRVKTSEIIISPLDCNPQEERHPIGCCYDPVKASIFDATRHFSEMQSAHITLNYLCQALMEHPTLSKIHIVTQKKCIFNLYKHALHWLFERKILDEIGEMRASISGKISMASAEEPVFLDEFLHNDAAIFGSYIEGVRTIQAARSSRK